jgi:hypothetical protein
VINPGSAGEARDARNDFQLSFAVLDTETDEVRFTNYIDPTRVVTATSGQSAPWQPSAGSRTESPVAGTDPWRTTLGT